MHYAHIVQGGFYYCENILSVEEERGDGDADMRDTKIYGRFCGMSKSLGRAPQPMANVRTGVLMTVHADGSETTRIARTWQSLAVAVDVLESHAFGYFFLCVGVPRRFTRAERTQGVEHRPSLGRGRKVSDRNLPYFFHALAGLACGVSSVRKRRAHSE